MNEADRNEQLRQELDALRLANAALQSQMLADAERTDAMLREVESQRNELREAHRHAQNLSSFVRRVMDSVDSLVVVLDPNGLIRQANQYCCKRLGVAEPELQGRVLDEYLDEMQRRVLADKLGHLPWPVHSPLFETVRKLGTYRGVLRLGGCNGSRHYQVSANLLFNPQGKEEGVVIDAADITELKQHQQRLLASESRLNEAQRIAKAGSWELDWVSGDFRWSAGVYSILGIENRPGIDRYECFVQRVHPDDRGRVESALEQAGRATESQDIEHRILLDDGSIRWVHHRYQAFLSPGGRALRTSGTIQDTTEQKQAQDQLRLAASVFNNSLNAVLIAGPDGRIRRVNQSFTLLTGYSAEETVGQTPRMLQSGCHDPLFYQNLWRKLLSDGKWEGELWNRRKDGEVIPVWESITAVKDPAGVVTHYIGIASDITEQKASAERIRRLAHYDMLTGLPNRYLLLERSERMLVRARRAASRFAVLFMDLDRFKQVNDSLGHPVGDRLLQAVGERLSSRLREQDTVARLGGDEFVVLLEDLRRRDDAALVASKLIDAIAEPFDIDDHNLSVGTTVGISIYPDHGTDVTTLIMNADLALYRAKEQGRGCYLYFQAEFTDQVNERMALESGLRNAIDQGEMSIAYQPLFHGYGRELVGAEALLRWQHPSRGPVRPDVFIPIAEDSGLIIRIGAWVLEQACTQARRWIDAGLNLQIIAVNLSGVQIQRGDIVATVEQVLRNTGLPARCLELEISETYVMTHAERDLSTLQALKDLGIQLAIDDFGTGQSSLGYLKQLPISTIKIDRTFIKDIGQDVSGETITAAIAQLGRGLSLNVIAEGVETEAQEQFLRGLNCDQVQGFRYSRPLDVQDFETLLGERLRATG